MPVDSFKFLPRLIAAFYQSTQIEATGPIPWTPLPAPLAECMFGLVTSGGLYQKEVETPFDLGRELNQPTWGDPTYRVIPVDIPQGQVGVSHLHVNPKSVLQDIDILLPIHRFQELIDQGWVGGLARHAYSFMGYQGFPPNPSEWKNNYGPQVAERLKADGVQCVLLTPS